MLVLANFLIAVVAALHLYFLVLEMFLWTRPLGLKTFRNSLEKATDSAVLAANQGLYNGFLAAGLIWGLVHGNPAFAFQIKTFFLLCVIVAGAYLLFTFDMWRNPRMGPIVQLVIGLAVAVGRRPR